MTPAADPEHEEADERLCDSCKKISIAGLRKAERVLAPSRDALVQSVDAGCSLCAFFLNEIERELPYYCETDGVRTPVRHQQSHRLTVRAQRWMDIEAPFLLPMYSSQKDWREDEYVKVHQNNGRDYEFRHLASFADAGDTSISPPWAAD